MSILSRFVQTLRSRAALASHVSLAPLVCIALLTPVRVASAQWPWTTAATPKGVTATSIGGVSTDGTRTGTVTFLVVTTPTYSQYDLMYKLDCGAFNNPGYWFGYYSYIPAQCLLVGPSEIMGSGPTLKITIPIKLPATALNGDVTLAVWPKNDSTAVRRGTVHLSWSPPGLLNASFAGSAPISITPVDGTVVTSPTFALSVDWCLPPYSWAPSRDVVFMGQHLVDSYVDYGPTLDCGSFGNSTWQALSITPWRQTLTATLANQTMAIVAVKSATFE